MNRRNDENREDLVTKKVDAPDSRFQTEQQVNPAVESGKTVTPDDSFVPKTNKSEGSVLRQEVASQVLTSKDAKSAGAGVNSPAVYGLRAMPFSGDTGTILGNPSGTPTLEKNLQGQTRFDKRISDANKNINFNASEQVLVEYKQIPALADSEDTVGFNGNPKNSTVRLQKNTGLTPAEDLYDRSLDFISQDMGVFVSGQRVEQNGVDSGTYPTGTYMLEDSDSGPAWVKTPFSAGKEPLSGNFMPTALEVKVKKENGQAFVSSFKVFERDLSANAEEYDTVNAASSNAAIDRNSAELTRQNIDAKAGSPSQKGFNPLGRSISEATRFLTYLRDLEASTGATVYTAYKFAQKARGHFLNRTAKDGQNFEDPAIDALYGGLTNATSMAELKALLGDPISGKGPFMFADGLARGSAALLLSVFDSTSKYKTKADIVNQPRGLKMHLQTADNNMDPFRCKGEFIAAINSVDAYSTIDHGYDPMSPVFIADNFKLVYPYSWARALQFTRSHPGPRTFQSEVPVYYYAAGAGLNEYYVYCADPVLNGVAYFMDLHAREIYDTLAGSGEKTLTIPIVHSTTHFSLWDYLICACTPYIIYERTNTMKDILDFEMNFEYPFMGLKSIKEANPMAAVNYGNPSALEPLTVKQMLPSSAIRWKYPEMLYPLGAETYLLPWYFSERDIDWTDPRTRSAKIRISAAQNFSTPVIRSGIKHAGLDDFFGMTVKDQLLNLDSMVRLPGTKSAVAGGVYKYAQDADGIPFVRATDSAIEAATVTDYMATPRQLGWFFVLPGSVTIPYRANASAANFFDFSLEEVPMCKAGTSYVATMYKGGLNPTTAPSDVLGNGAINIGRGQNFTQNWVKRYADGARTANANFDLLLSIVDGLKTSDALGSDVIVEAVDQQTLFRPFTFGPYSRTEGNTAAEVYGSASADANPKLFTIMRAYWASVQKMPFVINPFAGYAEPTNATEGAADPFDLAYLLGLAGFVAANFYEEQYDRANEVLHQGYGYTSDPLVAKSPVFKDGYKV